MKRILSGILLVLICLVSRVTPGYAQTCTCNTFASGDTIRSLPAQTICLNSNMTAVVMMNGGNLCIPAGDTLTMKRLFFSGGTITNNGVIVYDSTDYYSAFNNTQVTNNGTILLTKSSISIAPNTLNGTFILNAGFIELNSPLGMINNGTFICNADSTDIHCFGSASITNKGSMIINGLFKSTAVYFGMTPTSTTLDNYANASFRINGRVSTNYTFRHSFYITNRGTFTINGNADFVISTKIKNFDRFYIQNGHVTCAGEITNNSLFSISPSISFTTNQGFLTNHCKFLVADSLYTTQKAYNNGLLWITNPNGILSIGTGGSFENTAKGKINGARFSNSGTVKGSGEFYFTGETKQQGAFAGSYNSTDSFINFYDVSNTSPAIPGSFFDIGIQGARVKRVAITAADTLSFVCNLADSILVPLPIKMYGFKAEAVRGNVDLSWLTADEEKINVYEIQRSNTGADWKTIGNITAYKAPGKNSYQYTDREPYASLNLYRIKAVSIDNVATYSETRAVNLGNAAGNNQAAAYPNPVADKLNLVYLDAQQDVFLNYQVTDLSGKVMISKDWQIGSGGNTHTVNLAALSKGIYLLKLIDKNNGTVILLQKVVKN
jgi:hypothetical protein